MRIRLATADDARAVRAIYAPVVESTTVSFELVVPSEDEMAARICDRQPAYPWLVAEDVDGTDRGVCGYAYAGRFAPRPAYDWSVETSVYVAGAVHGRGVGGALYDALLGILAAQGYRQAMAGIALPNAGSVALHESRRFTLVGVYRASGWKFGAWHDVGWWQRPLGDGDDDDACAPSTPIPLDALPHGVVPT